MKYFKYLGVVTGCLLIASSSYAQSGKIVIQPKVQIGAQNNSNFWKAEDSETSVNTYTAKPGVVLGYETPKTAVTFDGTVDFFWYDDQDTPPEGTRDSSDDDYVGFTGEAAFNHQLTDRLNIDISDALFVTRDQAQADRNSNSIDRNKFTVNYFQPGVYYDIAEKFGIQAKYRNTYTDYEKDFEDSNEHRGIFDFYYNLNRSAAIFLDYQVWNRDYDQTSNDYTSNLVTLNYEHKFNYLSITGGAGYHNRSFDEDTLDDLDMFSWTIMINGIDPDSDMKTTRSFIDLSLGQEMNDDGTGDSYFTATYVRFEGGYRFFNRILTSLKAEYQNSDYDTEDRTDDTYLASGKIAYQALDFLTLGLEGGIETRDSDVTGNDYDDVFVAFTIDVDYDFGSR